MNLAPFAPPSMHIAKGNAEWFVKVFSDIRLRYPSYQIAIFKVTAPASASVAENKGCSCDLGKALHRKRSSARGSQTGPSKLVAASLSPPWWRALRLWKGRGKKKTTLQLEACRWVQTVTRSVLTLTPHADFLASIDNSASTPKLQYFAAIDRSGDWQRIATRFAHILPAADAFPKKLSPFFVSRLEICPKLQLQECLQCRTDGENRCQRGVLVMRGLSFDVKLSPAIRVTLDPETRRVANIHEDAVAVAFLHPLSGLPNSPAASELTYSEQQVLHLGAFANFNLDDELVALNSVASTTHQRQPALLAHRTQKFLLL